MATYHYNQHFGYPQQQQPDNSSSSSTHTQSHNNMNQQQQSAYNQGGNNHYSSGPGLDGYYGFTGPNTQQHQQNQAYFAQSSNGFGHGNGSNGNGLNHGYNPPQPQFMNPNYDPFELGVATGTGMFFNPSLQYMQQQQYFSNIQPQPHQQQHQQSNTTTNYLHRPTLETTNTISPNGSNPGSAQSSHLNLHSITPERTSTHTNTPPDREPTGSPVHDVITGPTRPLGRNREGPVKAACLSCRQKKAKCDGVKPICTQCNKKGLECVYVKSKRGGARKKRETIAPSALQEFLKKLDGLLSVHDPSLSPGTADESDDTTNVVRQFASRHEIFRCYYNEVHPFIPVMPPRAYLDEILETLLPESPFLLAAETILVLVPHSLDPNPKSSNSKRLRTAASAALGKKTMDAVEAVLESKNRSLEVPQALAMLSMWEWGNAGNLSLNRARANQSLQVLMEMGVNVMDKTQHPDGRALEGEDWRKDMARRTWWSAYAGQMTAAIISGNEPILGPDDNRVHIAYPVCSLGDTAWPNWINAMRQCVRVFSIVNAVYASVQSEGGGGQAWGGSPTELPASADPERLKQRMLEVDAEVMGLMQAAEKSAVIELVPGGEEEVVRNQQLSARLGLAVTHIHIHRQQAFPEVSLFSKRICGLPQAPDFSHLQVEDVGGTMPSAGSENMAQTLSNGISMLTTEVPGQQDDGDDYDIIDEMWEPETYPEDLPAPWFTNRGGATSLYAPTLDEPNHIPIMASIVPVNQTPSDGRRPSLVSSQISGTPKQHKAWGVDKDDKASPAPAGLGISKAMQIFPPGISLARCATAAHTIVRLEVLHRSAVIAMWDGPPKWLPFCSCGLVTGAYAFLLLALAVQADNDFATSEELVQKSEEVEALLTNVKVILAGLEAYGVMWAGIEVMAGEVRAALEAASRLPYEIRGQIETLSSTASPPSSQNGVKKLPSSQR